MRRSFLLPILLGLGSMAFLVAPATAGPKVCPAPCVVSGTAVGSFIMPNPDDFKVVIQGVYDGVARSGGSETPVTWKLHVSGSPKFYQGDVAGAFAAGTLRLTGPGAPTGKDSIVVPVVLSGTPEAFEMRNYGGSIAVDGSFTTDQGALQGEMSVTRPGFLAPGPVD